MNGSSVDVFARLRDFARGTPAGIDHGLHARAGTRHSVRAQEEHPPNGACELCSLPLTEMHRHLFEVASGQIVCACDGCALTFHGVANGRYKTVPRDVRVLDGEMVAAIPWEQLSLPINLAFFVREGEDGSVSAFYPSPGGVTKSMLPFGVLDASFDENGVFSSLDPYVEALLVNRLTQKTEAFVVPVDLCYELTGLIRLNWRGFSGGEEMRQEMHAFFDRIRSRARPIRSV